MDEWELWELWVHESAQTARPHLAVAASSARRRCSWPAARSGPTTSRRRRNVPAGWDGTTVAAPAQTSVATTEPAQLSEWWSVFNDPKLTQLVTDALKANLDLRTADRRCGRRARRAT